MGSFVAPLCLCVMGFFLGSYWNVHIGMTHIMMIEFVVVAGGVQSIVNNKHCHLWGVGAPGPGPGPGQGASPVAYY